MAYDKVVDSVKLDSDLTSVANGIRSILGSTAKMGLDGMPTQLGTAVSEIGTQADLMAQLSTILEGKAAGGGGLSDIHGFNSILTGEFTPATDITASHYVSFDDGSGINGNSIRDHAMVFWFTEIEPNDRTYPRAVAGFEINVYNSIISTGSAYHRSSCGLTIDRYGSITGTVVIQTSLQGTAQFRIDANTSKPLKAGLTVKWFILYKK